MAATVAGRVANRVERVVRQRRTAQVRMQQPARAVEHAGQAARGIARQPLGGRGNHRFPAGVVVAGKKRRALLVENGNDVSLHRTRAENGNEPRYSRFVEDAVDGRRPGALRRRRDAWKSST